MQKLKNLKKWVTGVGRVSKADKANGMTNKTYMENRFINETGIMNFRDILNITEKAESPISDIIDAYYLCKYGYNEIRGLIKVEPESPKKKPKKKWKPKPLIKGKPKKKEK